MNELNAFFDHLNGEHMLANVIPSGMGSSKTAGSDCKCHCDCLQTDCECDCRCDCKCDCKCYDDVPLGE